MTSLPTSLILEVIVSVLLATTVFYCALLDRRLRAIRSGQDGLRDLIRDLNGATEQALSAISDLRKASEETGDDLSSRVKRARGLADELSLMVQAGNDIADRLGAISVIRPLPEREAGMSAAASTLATAADVSSADRTRRGAVNGSAGDLGDAGVDESRRRAGEHPLLESLKRAR